MSLIKLRLGSLCYVLGLLCLIGSGGAAFGQYSTCAANNPQFIAVGPYPQGCTAHSNGTCTGAGCLYIYVNLGSSCQNIPFNTLCTNITRSNYDYAETVPCNYSNGTCVCGAFNPNAPMQQVPDSQVPSCYNGPPPV